ncbi:bifunctional metallophosphatase/5'-nucleotidase [Paucibacter aquatile]|uniref:Bifunctional metallophosphatase/5'-nucleotidase n=1 Tax=Kinneretia aquatilis TaxID=2070761 RepID=A0A2N8KVG3_9BURK|nr:bifunctional metallophosphatase/5'-nucleotidase [Paucibacter aquatile]
MHLAAHAPGRARAQGSASRWTGLSSLSLLALALAGCAAPVAPVATTPRELSIFSINDFHGHIQPKSPTPLMPRLPDPQTGEIKPQPAGGVAYLADALQKLRAPRQHSVFVAAGDLIGASPQLSSLLKDEPTLSALGELGLVATSLGNHELDAGLPELMRKARGECPANGCVWPEFKGPGFPYLAANLLDANSGRALLPSHVIKEVGGYKVAFVGAVTRDTPLVVVPRAITGLRFADEADTLNALVPQLRAEGAQLLVAVMHEGATQAGGANDPSYACPGIQGRGVDIANRLDPAYALIISGHTHQAYTCKIKGRLLVQAGSYGGWITESRLTLDAEGKVLDAQAVNHPVLQSAYQPNPAFVALVQRAAALTAAVRTKPVATLSQGAQRSTRAPFGDGTLGNLVADSQLAYAKKRGAADIALMNPGGIRADLTVEPGRPVTMSDLFAIQPFANELVVMSLSGAQLHELLLRQLPKGDAPPRMLQISHSLRYQWTQDADGSSRLTEVKVDGQPLDLQRNYRVVVNNFMADGGDGLSVLRQGKDRVPLGVDIDAMVEWLSENPAGAMAQIEPGRIRKQ